MKQLLFAAVLVFARSDLPCTASSLWQPHNSSSAAQQSNARGIRIGSASHSRVTLDDDVTPTGWEQVDAKVVLCRRAETEPVTDLKGNILSLQQHAVMCGELEFLAQWRMARVEEGKGYKIKYRCCSVVPELGPCEEVESPRRSSQRGHLLSLKHHSVECTGNSLMKGWQLNAQDDKISMRATCCPLAGKAKLGKCKDSITQSTAGSRDLRRLSKHDVTCGFPSVMTRWQLERRGRSQIAVGFSCCTAGEVVDLPLGERRTCRWIGDPHVMTFDGGRHETTRPGSGQTYWVVKSKDIGVQSYYEGTHANSPALTKGVVVFGRFLRGHKLVIKKDVPNLRRDASSFLEMESGSSSNLTQAGNIVTWDDKPIKDGESLRINGLVSIERKGMIVTATLPLGVELDVRQYGTYQDQGLTMARPRGGQVGQCGNNNGDRGDDANLEGRYPVSVEDNMFLKMGMGEGNQKAKELWDCRGERRRMAENKCRQSFRGKDFLQDYLNMCIYDVCFTDEGDMFVAADKEAEDEAREGLEAQQPRRYVVMSRVAGDGIASACGGEGHLGIVKITSKIEQRAVMEAIADVEDASTHLWVGGLFKERWEWRDGQEICGFENWDQTVKSKIREPPHEHLCVHKRTGKWFMCAGIAQLNVVCSTPKVYSIQDFAGPVGARSACAPTHDLAMPKSAAEQEALMRTVEHHGANKGFVWLGAAFRNERWEWDDGSKVCYTNWDDGEPAMEGETGQLWLAMSTETGKWKVLTGYRGYHSVPCETKLETLPCAKPKLSPSELRLTLIPGELYSSLRGHCYYLGKGGETCHETCWSQIDGYCDTNGLQWASSRKGICKMVLTRFGGNMAMDSETQEVSGDVGCSYKDMGSSGASTKTQVVVAKSAAATSCGTRTTTKSHHRVCACKDDMLLVYPLKHVVTTGETVRVCAKGWNRRNSFRVHLKSMDTLATSLLQGAEGSDEFLEWLQWAETKPPRRRRVQHSMKDRSSGDKLRKDRRLYFQEPAALLDVNTTTSEVPDLPKAGWKTAVLLTPGLPGGVADIGEARFNELFAECPIVMYFRHGHVHSVYRRLSDANAVNAHSLFTGTWGSHANLLGKDFAIYSTLEDAVADRHSWQYCNYDVPGVGYPRECGPAGPIKDEWFAMPSGTLEQGDAINGGFLVPEGQCPVAALQSEVKPHEIEAPPIGAIWLNLSQASATQSSVLWGGRPGKAIDGNKDGRYEVSKSCTHTDHEANPWWTLDLGDEMQSRIVGMKVSNRIDCCSSRLGSFLVYVGSQLCGEGRAGDTDAVVLVRCAQPQGLVGRSITIKHDRQHPSYLSLCEVEVQALPNAPRKMLQRSEEALVAEDAEEVAADDLDAHEQSEIAAEDEEDQEGDSQAEGGSRASQPGLITWGEQQEQVMGGSVQVALMFDPVRRMITKKYSHKEDFVTDKVPWWDMASPKLPWCVDFEAAEKVWKVRVNGRSYTELDIPRDLRKQITHINTDVNTPHFMLIPAEPLSMQTPLSMNSANGCMEHGFEATESVIGFSFVVRLRKLDGSPCVRCESRPIDQGSHLYFHNRKIRLAVEGASPRVQTFSLMFETDEKYKVDVVYISTENIVELYLNNLRVAMRHYKTAPPFKLKKGMLGCATASKEDGRRFDGQIVDFLVTTTPPITRPPRDKCSGEGGLGVQCPIGFVLKDNPSRIDCLSSVCSKHDVQICCTPRMKCDQYTCESHTLKKTDSTGVTCKGKHCRNDECCTNRAKCSSFTCPREEGKVLKDNPHTIACAGPTCSSQQDMETCCDELGKCEMFKCPAGYSRVPEALQLYCSDQACSSTNFGHCCAPNDKCASLACKEGYIHKSVGLPCPGRTCKAADHDFCCDRLAHCSTFRCPETYASRADPALRCKGRACIASDLHTCCVKKKTCQELTCPPLFIQKSSAHKIPCDDASCENTNFEKCCEALASCSSLTCPENYVPRTSVASLSCAGTSCLAESDVDTCCQRQATCNTTTCPAGQVHVHNASDVLCDGPECTNAEHAKCCVNRGLCTSMECPTGYVHTTSANSTYCLGKQCIDEDSNVCCDAKASCSHEVCRPGFAVRPDNFGLLCEGTKCSDQDHTTCCVKQGTCGSLQCPEDRVQRANASGVACLDPGCNSSKDILLCCDQRAACEPGACPLFFTLVHNATDILCKGSKCLAEYDDKTCCIEHGKCTSLACPDGYVHRPDAWSRFCTSSECQNTSSDDIHACCEPVAMCSSYACPANMLQRPNATGIPCKHPVCSEHDDTERCCQERASCTLFSCPNGTVLRSNANTRFCEDVVCEETDWHQCCAEDGTCASYSCRSGTVERANAGSILCPGTSCSSEDNHVCCEPCAPCIADVCPGDMVLKTSEHITCTGRACGPQDVEVCCKNKGRCDAYSCPPNYVVKAATPPNVLLCDDADCIETDFHVCCEPVARCTSYTCPNGYVGREVPETISCASQVCGEADRDTCCRPQADCSSMHCPADYVLVHNSSRIRCRGAECQADELPQCCVHKRSCNALPCPQSYVHRSASAEVLCDGEACTEADAPMCCERLGKCEGYPCPIGMVVQQSTGVCLHHGCLEEECCSPRATCDTMRCPAGKVHKRGVSNLLCEGVRCSEEKDLDKCCVPLGSCHAFACPEPDYILRGDADSLLCTNTLCPPSDYQVCCALKSRCSALISPPGFVLKANASSIICSGDSCGEDDVDLCCDARAPCSTFSHCPRGTIRNEDPSAFCRSHTCAIEDQGLCCDMTATCDMFTCPTGYTLRSNAADIWCNSRNCKNTDFEKCCMEAELCTNFSCPMAHVHRPDAAELLCIGPNCRAAEFLDRNRELCCERKATCDTAVCPGEMVLVQGAAAVTCTGPVCMDSDFKQCCAEPGDCRTYRCPAHMVPREATAPGSDLLCEGNECAVHDRATCCVSRSPCVHSACPSSHALREDSHGLLCASGTCNASVDRDTCCAPRATCAAFSCPSGYVSKSEAEDRQCEDVSCKDTDYRFCCDRKVHCDSFRCPIGFVHADGAADIPCSGDVCGERDKAVCCVRVAKCSTYACPQGFSLKVAAGNIPCRWSLCGDLDVHTCCEQESMCSAYTCPDGMVLRPHAHDIECRGGDCASTAASVCCANQAVCDSLACPNGMVHRKDSNIIQCSGKLTCTLTDVRKCCESAAPCNTMSCPKDWLPVDYPEMVSCSSGTCTNEADLKTCCVKQGTCGSYRCPTGLALRQDDKELHCHDAACERSSANTARCCDKEGMCSTYACRGGFHHRQDAGEIQCRDAVCRDVDRARCCQLSTALHNRTTKNTTHPLLHREQKARHDEGLHDAKSSTPGFDHKAAIMSTLCLMLYRWQWQ